MHKIRHWGIRYAYSNLGGIERATPTQRTSVRNGKHCERTSVSKKGYGRRRRRGACVFWQYDYRLLFSSPSFLLFTFSFGWNLNLPKANRAKNLYPLQKCALQTLTAFQIHRYYTHNSRQNARSHKFCSVLCRLLLFFVVYYYYLCLFAGIEWIAWPDECTSWPL